MQVDLYEGGTIAIVEAVSPELGNRVQRVRVQLPGTPPELLTKFREKKVDFAAHTQTEDGGSQILGLLGEWVRRWSWLGQGLELDGSGLQGEEWLDAKGGLIPTLWHGM